MENESDGRVIAFDQVVDAYLAQIEDGDIAPTIRAVAAALYVSPATLYPVVGNADALERSAIAALRTELRPLIDDATNGQPRPLLAWARGHQRSAIAASNPLVEPAESQFDVGPVDPLIVIGACIEHQRLSDAEVPTINHWLAALAQARHAIQRCPTTIDLRDGVDHPPSRGELVADVLSYAETVGSPVDTASVAIALEGRGWTFARLADESGRSVGALHRSGTRQMHLRRTGGLIDAALVDWAQRSATAVPDQCRHYAAAVAAVAPDRTKSPEYTGGLAPIPFGWRILSRTIAWQQTINGAVDDMVRLAAALGAAAGPELLSGD